MSIFSFTDPDSGKSFSVTAPAGVTEEQARAIFKQQLDTGSLAGIDIGKSLNAVSQAAAGLPGAAAQLNQFLGQAQGIIPGASNLNSITSALGPGAQAAATQVQSSLQGQGLSISTNSIGSTASAVADGIRNIPGAVSTAMSGLQQSAGEATALINKIVPGAGTSINNLVGSVVQSGSAISGGLTAAGGFAVDSLKSISSALNSPVTDGINTADLVKQGSAIGIPDLSAIDVRASLSQAAKLVNQPHTVVSNSSGVGKFGLGLDQLEKAGYVKPGTAALVAGTAAKLTSVLNSPLAFTGKDGVKSLDGILSNDALQDKIQTGLMQTGLQDLKTLGVPVDNLTPQAVAGLANNAAKSVTDTVNSLKGIAPPDVKAKFDEIARNSAFAVNVANDKTDKSALGEVTAEPAEDTVDTETVDAASERIVGNDKVPSVTQAGQDTPYNKTRAALQDYILFIDDVMQRFNALSLITTPLYQASSVTQAEYNNANQQYQEIRNYFNSANKSYVEATTVFRDKITNPAELAEIQKLEQSAARLLEIVLARNSTVKQILDAIANKIQA